MPLSDIALPIILRNEIIALGAVPLLTANELQREDATNILWTQLLALIRTDLDFNGLRAFVGSSTRVNVAGVSNFPGVISVALSAVNFPIGSSAKIGMAGTLANTSGIAIGYSAGFTIGAEVIASPAVVVGGAVALSRWLLEATYTRFTAGLAKLSSLKFMIDALPVGVLADSGVPLRVFANGMAIVPFSNMLVANPLTSIMLESFIVTTEKYAAIAV